MLVHWISPCHQSWGSLTMVCVGGCVCVCRRGWGGKPLWKECKWKVRIKFLKKTNLGWLKLYLATRVRTTGKNNRFPLLDILGYLKNTHKNPNLAKWDKSQLGNSQPSSLIGTYLTLPNLGFWWVFFKYPKISKNGNLFFFPVNWIDSYCSKDVEFECHL